MQRNYQLSINRKELNNYFLDYQSKWIVDDSRFKFYLKSRQIGLTYSASFRVIWKCLQRPNINWYWVSYSEKFGGEFLLHCRRWLQAMNITATYINAESIDVSKAVKMASIVLPNNSRIYVISSNPLSISGRSGYVTLDEFDLHRPKVQLQLYATAMPVANLGGGLEIISTYAQSANTLFARFAREIEKEETSLWSDYRTDFLQAVQSGLWIIANARRKHLGQQEITAQQFIDETKASCQSEEDWQQQFLCNPATDIRAVIPWLEIIAAQREWKELRFEEETPVYMGIDLGRSRDPSVIWTFKYKGDLFTQNIEVLDQMRWEDQENLIKARIESCNATKVCIDTTTRGDMLGEAIVTQFGERRIEKINFQSKQLQNDVVDHCEAAFSDGRVKIPRDDLVAHELYSVERLYSESGNVVYKSVDSERHSDRFWACALAIYASRGGHNNTFAARLKQPKAQPSSNLNWDDDYIQPARQQKVWDGY